MNKQQNKIKRWTAKRKTQVVVDILKGKTTVAEVSRQHDLTPGEVFPSVAPFRSAGRQGYSHEIPAAVCPTPGSVAFDFSGVGVGYSYGRMRRSTGIFVS